MFKKLYILLRETGQSFATHRSGERAAALSFYTLLTLVPVIMVMSSVLGFFLRSSDGASFSYVQELIQIVPVGQELFLQNIESLMQHRSSLGLVGLLGLLMIVHNLLKNLERAISRIFGEAHRTALTAHLFGMLFICALAMLLVLPHVLDLLGSLFAPLNLSAPFQLLGHTWYPFLGAFLSYVFLLRIIPKTYVEYSYAAFGGLIFALMWQLMGLVTRWYFHYAMTRYNLIYGSLTSLILMLLWLQYFFTMILFITELVAVLKRRQVFSKAG